MTNIKEAVDVKMSELQAKVDFYNETANLLEKTKEELIALQGAVNALKELQDEEEVTTVEAEIS